MSVFKNLIVKKSDISGNILEIIDVPIMTNQPEKEYQWLVQNHYFDKNNTEIGTRFYIKLPRMSLCFTGLSYAADRATSVNEVREWFNTDVNLSQDDVDSVMTDIQPAPWNLNFMLYIRTDSYEYMAQLLENVLPYFNPKIQLRVKEFSFLNVERTLPVSIDTVTPTITMDIGENDYRQVNCDLPLTVEGFLYKPWTDKSIIKVINTNYFVDNVLEKSINLSGSPVLSGNFAVPDNFILSGSDTASFGNYVWFEGENN